MPDGCVPTQFVAEQLNSPVAPSGESVEESALIEDNSVSNSHDADDKGMYILRTTIHTLNAVFELLLG